MPKFNIGAKVKATKGSQMGNVGTVKTVLLSTPRTETEYEISFDTKPYYLTLPESSLQETTGEIHITKAALDYILTHPSDFSEQTVERFKVIGSISTVFTEADTSTIFTESAKLSNIKETTHKDVTSKYFINWFFKLDNWVGHNPQGFPFGILTHNSKDSAYGYFNGSNLDGMICVDASGEISFFCVNPACQKHGIGQYLFQYAIDKHSDKKLVLHVYTDNSPAIHIYEKYGFTKTGIGYDRGYSPELPHYIMKKEGIEE